MKRINLNLSRNLPILGIVSFSLASTWTLYNLFDAYAKHPSQLYWAPAILVEIVTAWLVYQSVAILHQLTRSNNSKQDRRFYTIVLALFLVLCIPTLGATLWANYWQFSNLALAALFPAASIICAVAASLPDSVARYQSTRAQEKEEARKTREANRKAKEDRQEAIRRQQELDRKAQEVGRKIQEAQRVQIAQLGAAGRVLEVYQAQPDATQQEVAEALGITDRAVRYHLNTLAEVGLVERNGHGLRIIGG